MADTIGFKPTSVNVNGLTALIRNLGRDCTPEQFIREFVQNSLEACQRTELADRRVVVDYNHTLHGHSGYFKMCFTDNGDGMGLEQMNNLLNSISASGSSTNTFENYGVGAKISSLTRNHFGVQYESWKNGVGHAIIIRHNPKFDVFGIQGFQDANDNIVYHRNIAASQKPEMIKEHGTRVTLFGDQLEQDTMAPPHGVSGDKSTWLFDYLNRRYFELPEGIAVDVRKGYDQDPLNTDLNYVSPLVSFKDSLMADSNQFGVLALADAKAHWWILKEGSKLKGHSALLNQGEIFNVESDRSNRLTHFGILLGRDKVVIIIEPNEASQNIARTHLKKPDGSDFSWSRWQDEFRSRLPAEIQEYLESLLSQRNKASSSKAIQKRLMSLQSLYELCGFKSLVVHTPIQNLKYEEHPELDTVLKDAAASDLHTPSESDTNKPEVSEPSSDKKPQDGQQKSDDLDENHEDFFPRVEWTTEAQSAQLTGRAAEFIEYSNIILANQDFKGLQDLFKYFAARYELTDDSMKAVRHAILENAEQALMESVAGVLSLKTESSWKGSYHQALSKEALSAVVMQRFWSVKAIEAELQTALNKSANVAST